MNACPYCGQSVAPDDLTCSACGSPLGGFVLPQDALLADGKLRLERVLGQGGFGITYAAVSVALGIPVAVKEFFPEGSTRRGTQLVPPTTLLGQGFTETMNRFLEEAQLLARFQHPGVVRVYDAFSENNTAYLVMEKLDGETLGARLSRVGTLPSGEIESLALELLDALAAVHDAGLLHRDLKPDNLFLRPDGHAVLIDFGSARGFSGSKTVQHTRLVTPGYAAPEQYASSARFGPYTDLYGLAATLFHTATGQMPPSATDRFIGAPLPALPTSLGAGLRAAIERGLTLSVAERPQTVAAFVGMIRGSSANNSVSVIGPMLEEKRRWYRQLLWIARQRGYKEGWVSHRYSDKFNEWPMDGMKSLPPEPAMADVLDFVKASKPQFLPKTVQLPPSASQSQSGQSRSSQAASAERVIYRSGNVILTTRYLTIGTETVPLLRFSRVDLERSFSQSAQLGSYGCLGCTGVLLLMVFPPVGAFLIVFSVIAAFISRVARNEVFHVSLRGPQGRVRVMSTNDKREAEALLEELVKLV